MERRDFFISYTKADRDWAVWIADVLTSHGYTVYIQALHIGPGDNFLTKMNQFLENSGNFIAVWSKGYSESWYCMREMEAAFQACHKKQMGCLLPVLIDSHPMPLLYSALVHVDLFGKEKAEAESELIDAVKYATAHSDTKPKPEPELKPKPELKSDTEERKRLFRHLKYTLVILCFVALILAGYVILPRVQKVLEVHEARNLYQIGNNYYYGENGVEVDYTKAREYYEQATVKGSTDALNNLGWLYQNGYGVEVNYTKAREYYEQAAAKGNVQALTNLGIFYEKGYSVKIDYDKAREYYEQAAIKGNADALFALGVLYRYGRGVERDYDKAREYYEQVAQKGDADALVALGWLYENGCGVEQDYDKAMEYYQKAVAAGSPVAVFNLATLREELNG